jgi:hypothetical protein
MSGRLEQALIPCPPSSALSACPCIQIVRHVGITDLTLEDKYALLYYFHGMSEQIEKFRFQVFTAVKMSMLVF